MDIYTLSNIKQIASGKQPHSTGRSAWCFVSTQRGGVGRVGERCKREEIQVYIQLIHFIVQKKLTQHCKAIILQFKKKKTMQIKVMKIVVLVERQTQRSIKQNKDARNRRTHIDTTNFWQGIKAIQSRKDSLFNKQASISKKMNLDQNLTIYTKINSKGIIDLKVTL